MSDYQLLNSPGCIIRLSDGACIPADESNRDYEAYLDWCAAGGIPVPAPLVTVNDIIGEFLPQLQAWLDGVAKQNGYDSSLSCISYLDCTVAQWAADAAAMKAYRAALWTWAYAQQVTLDAMTPEQLAAITVDQIIAQAPKASDYGWVVHATPAASAAATSAPAASPATA